MGTMGMPLDTIHQRCWQNASDARSVFKLEPVGEICQFKAKGPRLPTPTLDKRLNTWNAYVNYFTCQRLCNSHQPVSFVIETTLLDSTNRFWTSLNTIIFDQYIMASLCLSCVFLVLDIHCAKQGSPDIESGTTLSSGLLMVTEGGNWWYKSHCEI